MVFSAVFIFFLFRFLSEFVIFVSFADLANYFNGKFLYVWVVLILIFTLGYKLDANLALICYQTSGC